MSDLSLIKIKIIIYSLTGLILLILFVVGNKGMAYNIEKLKAIAGKLLVLFLVLLAVSIFLMFQ